MASADDLFSRLSDNLRTRREACRRNLSLDERARLLERLVAGDGWLARLTEREADAILAREIRNRAARVWFLARICEGEDSLTALARRELVALDSLEGPTREEISRAVSPLRRSLESFLAEYERRRGRFVSKWSLGFGEVSTSVAIKGNENLVHEHPGGVWGRRVYKRMPLFPSRRDVERYRQVYLEYDRLLRQEVGLDLPPTGVQVLDRGGEALLVFVWQLQLDPETIGPVVLRRLGTEGAVALLDSVLDNLELLFAANERLRERGFTVGLDGQITNWAVRNLGDMPPRPKLVFLDTNTPLIRKDGRETLDTEVFLHALSPMLRPVVRRFFLPKILDRYYDPRTIILDFLGNTIVQGRPDLVGRFVRRVEERRAGDLSPYGIAPISETDVERYFREDVFTWRLVRTAKTLQEVASEAASANLGMAWRKLRQVRTIWTSKLFDVDDAPLGGAGSDAMD